MLVGIKGKFIAKLLLKIKNWLRLLNSSWDEWVPENRVLKYNEAALQKQKELLIAHEAEQ